MAGDERLSTHVLGSLSKRARDRSFGAVIHLPFFLVLRREWDTKIKGGEKKRRWNADRNGYMPIERIRA